MAIKLVKICWASHDSIIKSPGVRGAFYKNLLNYLPLFVINSPRIKMIDSLRMEKSITIFLNMVHDSIFLLVCAPCCIFFMHLHFRIYYPA